MHDGVVNDGGVIDNGGGVGVGRGGGGGVTVGVVGGNPALGGGHLLLLTVMGGRGLGVGVGVLLLYRLTAVSLLPGVGECQGKDVGVVVVLWAQLLVCVGVSTCGGRW